MMKYNTEIQNYKGIKVRLIKYTDKHFARLKAKRFMLVGSDENSKQNLWIPNKLKYAGVKTPGWLAND